MKKAERYYLWFLGSRELSVLRDTNSIQKSALDIMRSQGVQDRGKKISCPKVNLEINMKGIKVTQILMKEMSCKSGFIPKKDKCKEDHIIKYFLPAHAIVSSQILGPDIVLCVFLIYNPETQCPIHVYAYRADTADTARNLDRQLQALISDKENAEKLAKLEEKLKTNGMISPSNHHHHHDLIGLDNDSHHFRSSGGDQCNFRDSSRYYSLESDHTHSSNTDVVDGSDARLVRENSYYFVNGSNSGKTDYNRYKIEEFSHLDEGPKQRSKPGLRDGTTSPQNILICGHAGIRNYLKNKPKNPLVLELEKKVKAKARAPVFIPPEDYDDGIYLNETQEGDSLSPTQSFEIRSPIKVQPFADPQTVKKNQASPLVPPSRDDLPARCRQKNGKTIFTEDGIMLTDNMACHSKFDRDTGRIGSQSQNSVSTHSAYNNNSHHLQCHKYDEEDEGISRTTTNSSSFSSQGSGGGRNIFEKQVKIVDDDKVLPKGESKRFTEVMVDGDVKGASNQRTKNYRNESRYFCDHPGFGDPEKSFLKQNGYEISKFLGLPYVRKGQQLPLKVDRERSPQKTNGSGEKYFEHLNKAHPSPQSNTSFTSIDSCANSFNPSALACHKNYFDKEFKNRLIHH